MENVKDVYDTGTGIKGTSDTVFNDTNTLIESFPQGKQVGFMEILNKILPLILTAIMSVNLSGCDNSTGANGSQPAETSSATIVTNEIAENKELTQVSVEEFANSLYIEGNHIPFPCTFGELCDSFDFESIEENIAASRDLYRNTELIAFSYKLFLPKLSRNPGDNQGHFLCTVVAKSPENINKSDVVWLCYVPGDENYEISGICRNSTFEDMIYVLGDKYTLNEWLDYEYCENDIGVRIDLGSFDHIYDNKTDNNDNQKICEIILERNDYDEEAKYGNK